MHTVLVLMGGGSDEHAISIRTGDAVAAALRAAGHTVITADPAKGIALGSTIDVVFPALHGKGGEDGSIQALLDAHAVPYVGSGSEASALCFDKNRFRDFIAEQGVDVPMGTMVTRQTVWQSPLVQQPFVLKPHDGGSSVDTFIVRDPAQADTTAINASFDRHPRMLLEELISGVEISVGVLGDTVLPVVEIIPPEHAEFDYENKYNGLTQELCPPPHVTKDIQKQAQDIALQLHHATGCRDLSRTDCIVTPDGRIVILELNTLPGMTDASIFPIAAAATGLSFPEVCDALVGMALRRKNTRLTGRHTPDNGTSSTL